MLPKSGAALEDLRYTQASLVRFLCDHQVDFDLGDELLLEEFGSAGDARLVCGEQAYDVVVLPENMDNCCETTLELLQAFLDAGGTVVALGEPPTLVNGRPDERPAGLRKGAGFRTAANHADLLVALETVAPPYVRLQPDAPLADGVGYQHRVLDDGARLHVLVNASHEPVSGRLAVEAAAVTALDTLSGGEEPLAGETADGWCTVPFTLPSAGHLVLRAETRPHADAPAPLPTWSMLDVTPAGVPERTAPNAVPLDYCDVRIGGATHERLKVTAANLMVWRAHGFDQDVWDCAVQFRDSYKHFIFPQDSGFELTYHFEVAGTPAGPVRFACERPELYRITVNGAELDQAGGERWLDEVIKAFDITARLKPGANSVTLTAKPFHLLCEVAPAYLVGEFATVPVAQGFAIEPARDLSPGDWTAQGIPTYSGSVRYPFRFTANQPAGRLRVGLPDWKGSVAAVHLDGAPVGHVGWPPHVADVELELEAGDHDLVIEVVGLPYNLLGPHFATKEQSPPGPGAWNIAPDHQPPGKDYRTLPCGLMAPPVVEVA
jgi:hypothetical protein